MGLRPPSSRNSVGTLLCTERERAPLPVERCKQSEEMRLEGCGKETRTGAWSEARATKRQVKGWWSLSQARGRDFSKNVDNLLPTTNPGHGGAHPHRRTRANASRAHMYTHTHAHCTVTPVHTVADPSPWQSACASTLLRTKVSS